MPFTAFGPSTFALSVYPVSREIPFYTLQHSLGEVCGSEYTAAAPRLIFQATGIFVDFSTRSCIFFLR